MLFRNGGRGGGGGHAGATPKMGGIGGGSGAFRAMSEPLWDCPIRVLIWPVFYHGPIVSIRLHQKLGVDVRAARLLATAPYSKTSHQVPFWHSAARNGLGAKFWSERKAPPRFRIRIIPAQRPSQLHLAPECASETLHQALFWHRAARNGPGAKFSSGQKVLEKSAGAVARPRSLGSPHDIALMLEAGLKNQARGVWAIASVQLA